MFALNVITVGKLYPLIYSMMIIFRVGTISVKANFEIANEMVLRTICTTYVHNTYLLSPILISKPHHEIGKKTKSGGARKM